MNLHAPTIFLGSFLLFLVQPLIGRYILPWFGGGPAVWTTCMLFFQAMLLAGYGYAHGATLLKRRHQWMLHLALLLTALIFLPIVPAAGWRPATGAAPIATILLVLGATIGVPYLALAASAPLVQHWFVRDCPGRVPYRLYALSNAASLLALLGYPLLLEPLLTRHQQVMVWSGGFTLYAVLCAVCAMRPGSVELAVEQIIADEPHPVGTARPRGGTFLLWFILSAAGSALLLATTNQLCLDVASVPFLWVIPLILYLATFIICFGRRKDYDPIIWGIVLAGLLLMTCRVLVAGARVQLPTQIITCLAVLFAGCLVCHGELVRWRPEPRRLTAYYLVIAAGGAAGGLLVALLPPLIFTGFWEYPLSLVSVSLVVFASQVRDRGGERIPNWLLLLHGTCVAGLALFSWHYFLAGQPGDEYRTRNFYGVLRVNKLEAPGGQLRVLVHGRTVHGTQFTDVAKRRLPTTYYGTSSGIGLALRHHPRRQRGTPLRVGVVGLGTGTLAAYGQPGDTMRFYEINPAVIDVAKQYFTYLADSPAGISLVEGDARLKLEGELADNKAQNFDVLAIDAFSSDAIPVHLLTRECLAVYGRHLAEGGLLLFHVTNRYLDLLPVVRALGEEAGYRMALIHSASVAGSGEGKSSWMILDRTGSFVQNPILRPGTVPLPPPAVRPWSDDYASLLPLIRW